MTTKEKIKALNELVKTNPELIVNTLNDEFFNKYVRVETIYELLLTPKKTYVALYGVDQYADNVKSAEISRGEDGFISIRFTIRYADPEHFVWGTLNRYFNIHEKDVEKRSDVIGVEKMIQII